MNQKVLIVNDQQNIRDMISLALELVDIKVLVARNARHALAQLSKHNVDLLLTGWLLADGGGKDLIINIRQRDGLQNLPVVVFSCLKQPEDTLNSDLLKIHCWLRKPCRASELQKVVNDALTRGLADFRAAAV